MENSKKWFESKSIQGNIVTVLGFIATKYNLPILSDEIGAGVSAILVLVGIGYSIYGRLNASKVIR